MNNQFQIKNPDYEEVAGNIVCYFNYNSPQCSPVEPGRTDQTIASAHFRAVNESTDMALLELQDTLEAQARELADKEEKFRFTPEQIKAYSTIGGAPHLDGSYTVFGEVTEGMEVVDNIEIAKTNRADRPIENIRILKASIQ